jgi:hypothetical protein
MRLKGGGRGCHSRAVWVRFVTHHYPAPTTPLLVILRGSSQQPLWVDAECNTQFVDRGIGWITPI